jgi:predicted O-linked N-acetylglucosamine transferase (SPINDLY family)
MIFQSTPALALPFTAGQQLAFARRASIKPPPPLPFPGNPVWDGVRPLRLGYVSSDFRDHPVAQLLGGLFALHDRERVHVTAYSVAAADGSDYQRRIRAGCDTFVEAAGWSHGQLARHIRADAIDVLVDLNGLTEGHRLEVFAARPAPAQVTWLGYPGTTGLDCFDAIMADGVLIHPRDEADYSEPVVRLPHCYQVNDDAQPIAEEIPTRAEAGLPEDGFVFACFNAHFKIEPTIFAAWMRILARVPGGVLWLMAAGEDAEANLRAEAARAGIDPGRLVFAQRMPRARHRARHALAGLFLDTRYYGAHTTASDSLWSGLPLVTCPADTFASRVSASLLTTIGLPELIAPDLAAYEDLAVALAGDPARLAELRARLWSNRRTSPLYDTARFARDLEDCLIAVFRRKVGISG